MDLLQLAERGVLLLVFLFVCMIPFGVMGALLDRSAGKYTDKLREEKQDSQVEAQREWNRQHPL